MSKQDSQKSFKEFAKNVPPLPTSLLAVSCEHVLDLPNQEVCWLCAYQTLHESTLTTEIAKLRTNVEILTRIVSERNATITNLQNALQSSAASMVTAIDRIQELEKVFEAAKVVLISKSSSDYERRYKILVEIVNEQQRRIETRS